MQGLAGSLRPVRALLVDDDVAYLEVLRFFLEREGSIDVETTTSAKHALEMLSKKEYDAIVSDYLMPDMDGLEFLKIVRLQGKDVPFIMLTGRGREDVAIEALNNGADFYIQKGGDPKAQYTDLSNMIRRSVQQRRAERSVREGERFLKMLFQSIQDGVSVLNKDFVIEKVNPTVERWYKDSMPLVGKKCYEAFHGRTEPCETCPTLRTLRSGRADSDRITKDCVGIEYAGWLDIYSFPMLNEETGEIEHVIEYLRDVTEEEQAKRSLQDSEVKYKSLVNLASEGILVIDAGGTIAFANPKMAEILGYDAEDLQGRPVQSIVDRRSIGTGDTSGLHRGLERGERVELTMSRKDGQPVDVIIAASPISADSGFTGGAMAVVTDITPLKMAMDGVLSSEEKYAKVFRDSPQMVMISRTSDSKIIEVNDSFARVIGLPRSQLLGKSYIELGILSKETSQVIERTLTEDGIVRDTTAVINDASGNGTPVSLSGYRMDLQGEECTVLTSSDIPSETVGARGLRLERDVLKTILDSTPNGFLITDLEGDILECNSFVRNMLGGVPRERLIGRSVFTLLGHEERAKAMRVGKKLMDEGSVNEISFIVTRDDGLTIHVDISATVVTDSQGKPLYIIGNVRDVTDHVRHRTELERALEDRRQLVSIINQGPAVAFLRQAEPGWPVEYVSENVRQFGYEVGEFTSGIMDFSSIVHPDDIDRLEEEVQSSVDQGRLEFEQEYRIISPEGETFWVYDRTTVIRNHKGEVESFQGVVVDITDRKDALERLSRTEKQLMMFMDLSPVIEFMKDRTGKYVYVNKMQKEIFHVAPTEWIGKTDAEIFPHEVAVKLREADEKVFGTGKFHSFQETIPQVDGMHEYLTYKFLVPSISGGEDLLAGVSVDLTEQRRYERALKAANKKLNLLGSMTRHDIMNQLAILVGWLEVVRESTVDSTVSGRLNDVRRAADTIQRLLVFASEYQSMGEQEPAWVDVAMSFRDGMMGLPAKGVEIEIGVHGLQVYADPMLGRVFRNLVDNSLRHGGEVSRIKLTERMDGNDLILVYEDDGVGLTSETRSRLFEKGFGKHTGLGLFMVREVLDLTGMSIAEVGAEGAGAKFEIRVPEGCYRHDTDKS